MSTMKNKTWINANQIFATYNDYKFAKLMKKYFEFILKKRSFFIKKLL
jgi:hypothetical protein